MRITQIIRNWPLITLIILGAFYRLWGLGANYSFWTDENHVAMFARAILERGRPALGNGYNTGVYQWLWYWLTAGSMKIFGVNEMAARLPAAVFGMLTIGMAYFLAREVWGGGKNRGDWGDKRDRGEEKRKGDGGEEGEKKEERGIIIALMAAFLIAFLNIEILMSRQARPYQALQFFYLAAAYCLLRAGGKKELGGWGRLGRLGGLRGLGGVGFLAAGILASLIHGLGLVIIFTGFVFLLVANWDDLKKFSLPGVVLGAVFGYVFRVQLFSLPSQLGSINNLFYYRVFLTHNYLPLVGLGGLGFLGLLGRRQYKELFLFGLILGVQGFIVSFVLGQPFTRYFYPVFGFVAVLAAGGAGEIIEKISNLKLQITNKFQITNYKLQKLLWFLLIFLFLVSLREKLSFWPREIYSLNADMQEIPEVDWKKIYGLAEKKLAENPEAVLVVNWNDLPVWYLGEGFDRLYWTRKIVRGERDPVSGAVTVGSLAGLEKVIEKNGKGLVIFDSWDNWLPDGVREYARDNLKKELEVDRLYPVQSRYWPVNVYSWGMKRD